jgi:Uma2 family endonuclease
MPTVTRRPKAPPKPDTLADVLKALGDIPLDRILWTPRPGTATEADALRCVEGGPRRLTELIDGTLVEKPMGQFESYVAHLLSMLIGQFVHERDLGIVGGADILLRILPAQLRLPDVAFTAWETLPTADAHLQPIGDYVPDLVVEVLSVGNTAAEIARKIAEYFKGGTKLVWVFEPDDRTVAVYTSPKKSRLLTATDALSGGKVLPGFTLDLAAFWNHPQLNPRTTR